MPAYPITCVGAPKSLKILQEHAKQPTEICTEDGLPECKRRPGNLCMTVRACFSVSGNKFAQISETENLDSLVYAAGICRTDTAQEIEADCAKLKGKASEDGSAASCSDYSFGARTFPCNQVHSSESSDDLSRWHLHGAFSHITCKAGTANCSHPNTATFACCASKTMLLADKVQSGKSTGGLVLTCNLCASQVSSSEMLIWHFPHPREEL